MMFVLSTKPILNGKKIDEIYIEGDDFYEEGANFLFLKGSTFPPYENNKRIFDEINRKGIEVIKEIRGEFFAVFYDHNSKMIYVGNDRLGRENVFYYYDKGDFVISDDFWKIMSIIEPRKSDIDVEAVKEFLVLDRPLFFKTIIKHVNFFPPAIIGSFSTEERKLNMNVYFDFKFNPDESIDIETAVERLDTLIDNAVKRIKEKHPDSTFGFGLSGGLDSRLIPHYLLKNKMKVKSFIIGQRKPNKVLLSKDHLNARRIAKLFHLDHSEVTPDCTSLESKSYLIIRHSPMAKARYFDTVEESKLPEFDIYITGMDGGELLGAYLPPDIQDMNDEELVDSIMRGWGSPKKYKKGLARDFINFISNMDIGEIPYGFKLILRFAKSRRKDRNLISQADLSRIRSKIREFVEDEKEKGKNNIEIYEKFLLQHSVHNNKYCIFSTYCKNVNYSIFSDIYLLEEITKWKPEYLLNEKLRIHFYLKKFPELSKIPLQDKRLPPFYRQRKSLLFRIKDTLSYFLRGTGINYVRWERGERFSSFAREVLLRPNEFFEEIFDVNKVLTQEPIHRNLVKIKQMLDLINSGEYRRFL